MHSSVLYTNPKRKRGKSLRALLALRVSVEAGRVQYGSPVEADATCGMPVNSATVYPATKCSFTNRRRSFRLRTRWTASRNDAKFGSDLAK
jgi:hypothetical protein